MTFQADGFIPECPGINFVDECPGNPAGKMPKLSSENQAFISFWQDIHPWLGNGMGGFVINAVTEQFKVYRVSLDQRPAIMDLCNVMVRAYYEIKALEDDK